MKRNQRNGGFSQWIADLGNCYSLFRYSVIRLSGYPVIRYVDKSIWAFLKNEQGNDYGTDIHSYNDERY